MKTPEDEAFDDLARNQGAWGGGFPAKRAMAADKLQEPVCDKDPQGCWNVRCQLGKQCKNLAQPEALKLALEALEINLVFLKNVEPFRGQEDLASDCVSMTEETIASIKEALAQPAQEPVACVQDLDEVKRKHLVYEKGMDWKDPLYTTPPQREWVGLTGDELADLWYKESLDWMEFARAHEAKLKEKNT